MPGVTILWSMCAAVSLLIAGIHLAVWVRHRAAKSSLALALLSLGVAAAAGAEYLLMHAASPAEFAAVMRWANFAILAMFVGIVWFVRAEFGTARLALGGVAVALRATALVLGYFPGVTPMFREIAALREVAWLGEQIVVVSAATPAPWSWLPALSNYVLALFVADASIRLWRRGGPDDRPRALRAGGAMVAFILLSTSVAMLINAGVLRVPYITAPSYLAMILMLGFELGRDILRARELVREVRRREAQLNESERRLQLAGEAADLGFWYWEMRTGSIWATERARSILGLPASGELTYPMFIERVHAEDRAIVEARIAAAFLDGSGYDAEYRVVLADGTPRWVTAHGDVAAGEDGRPASMTGVVFDTTERRRAELELADQRHELAHLSRVALVSELSGSLAHEINQPLAIILTNAQAAQRFLARTAPDVGEAREALADIVREAGRAGEVIRRLRGMLRNGHAVLKPVDVRDLIEDVCQLMRRDLDARGVRLLRVIADGLPAVAGDAVQLQQVLLNLVLNGCEAMEGNPPEGRVLTVSAARSGSGVRVSIADTGHGLPADAERVFQPFFTTKPDGLGLGLPICRSIVKSHGGRLWAEPRRPASGGADDGGATGAVFHLELDAVEHS